MIVEVAEFEYIEVIRGLEVKCKTEAAAGGCCTLRKSFNLGSASCIQQSSSSSSSSSSAKPRKPAGLNRAHFFFLLQNGRNLSYILRVLDAMQNTLDKCRSHSEMYFGEDPSPLAASLSGAVVILWLAVMCWWSIKPMASIELTAAAAAGAAARRPKNQKFDKKRGNP